MFKLKEWNQEPIKSSIKMYFFHSLIVFFIKLKKKNPPRKKWAIELYEKECSFRGIQNYLSLIELKCG